MPPLTRIRESDVERVEGVERNVSVRPSEKAPVGEMLTPTTGLNTSGWLRSIGARVPTPPSVGANWFSRAISRPRLRSWRSRPVVSRAVRFVWFEKMSLCRSFAWRLSVTRLVAGLYAAGFAMLVITASRVVVL